MEIFEKAKIGNCELENRIIRSATYEGRCDDNGFPGEAYIRFYDELAQGGIGGIITGLAYISEDGKTMQPGQAGIDNIEKVPYYREMTRQVHLHGSKVFLQLLHAGRQTKGSITGSRVMGASTKRSAYFKEKPEKMNKAEIGRLARQFGDAAYNAREAGFDGVQIHAAHGYLLHQFILPSINNRNDEYGVNKVEKIGKRFLERVIKNIRKRCGVNFPLIVKVSSGDDYFNRFSRNQFINLINYLDKLKVDAIEVSYGTMDYALSIFRGDLPAKLILANNPFYKDKSKVMKWLNRSLYFPLYRSKIKSFKPMYNLKYAELARKHTKIPVISVGGFRTKQEIAHAIQDSNIDFVSMSRPFIAEPDLVLKLKNNTSYQSKCCNCNYCSIMCDTNNVTQCYKN